MNTEPIVIPINGDASDFIADSSRVNGSLNSIEGNAKKTSMSVTDLRSSFQLAADAARIAGEVWQNTAGVAVDLANDVRSLRDVTGQSAEESSRLIQVLDDYKITVEDADKATKKLASEGMEFNIQTLARLSDEFLKLNPGVERTTFLYDNFGKSGDKFAEIMLQGGDAILAANDAISKNLVLSDKQLKAARDYEKALDDTTDSITGLKVAIGNELLPIGNDLLSVIQKQIDAGLEWQDLIGPLGLIDNFNKLKEAQFESKIASMDMAEGMKETASAAKDNTVALDDTTVSVEDFTKANQDYLNSIGGLTKELDNQKEKLDEIKEKYGENSQEYADATAEFEQNTHRRMLAMLEEQLSVDGLNEKETTFLLEQGVKWGIYSEEAITAMQNIQKQVDAMERLIDININVLTTYSEAGNAAKALQIAGEKDYNPTNSHATGGSFMIPMGYGNEGFRMGNGDTASGGEMVQITPRGQDPNKAVVEAIYATRITAEDIARAVVIAAQQVSK